MVGLALYLDGPAVIGDNRIADRKAEAGSLTYLRGGIKGIENTVNVGFGNPAAGIRDLYHHVSGTAAARDGETTAFGHGRQRVQKQVQKHLFNQSRNSATAQLPVGELAGNLHLLNARLVGYQCDGLAQGLLAEGFATRV